MVTVLQHEKAKQIAEYWLSKVDAYGEMGAIGEQSDEAIIARAYLEMLAAGNDRSADGVATNSTK